MIEFGRRVMRRRLTMKMSQAKVASLVSMSRPWLVDIEKGRGNPPAEKITALAIALGEDPREYLKLAGRVALTADDLVPARVAALPPETAAAVERAVARALEPFVERMDRLLAALEQRQDGPAGETGQR